MNLPCPKCHEPMDELLASWGDIKFAWKCRSCGKVAEWFVVPLDRCALCGGEMMSIADKPYPNPAALEALQTTLQMEIQAYHYYHILAAKLPDGPARVAIQGFMQREKEHFKILSDRYHVHEPLDRDPETVSRIRAWLVRDLDFSPGGALKPLYGHAIAMEEKSREFYKGLEGSALSTGLREMYRELAAEEAGHAAELRQERDRLGGK